jgi:hypothetical protein
MSDIKLGFMTAATSCLIIFQPLVFSVKRIELQNTHWFIVFGSLSLKCWFSFRIKPILSNVTACQKKYRSQKENSQSALFEGCVQS